MTLILAVGNNEFVAHISDRRLSTNGELVDDESNKCGVLICLNARMTFGYTGLAKWGRFSTIDWLLKAISDAGAPDFTIGETLERLKKCATETFRNDSTLKRLPEEHKRLAIMFSGYINLDGRIKQGCAILSNYHDFINDASFCQAQEEFNIHYSSAKENEFNPTLVQRVGNWRAMVDREIDELRTLLSDMKPSNAVIGKACKIIRDSADRPKAFGTIGKQLTTIVIPKDENLPIVTNYSSNEIRSETYMPAMIYLLPSNHMVIDKITIRPVEEDTPPISVPKVSRNRLCPCGSTKKYKNCHGQRRK